MNIQFTTSPAFTQAQLAALEQMLEIHSTTRFAVLPSAIPIDKVVGLDRLGPSVIIEFSAFDNIPAGSVRVSPHLSHHYGNPVLVRPASQVENLPSVQRAAKKKAFIATIDADVTLLMNEGSLHDGRYLGLLKEELERHLVGAQVFECEPAFLGHTHYETTRAKWTDALCAWLNNDPDGRNVHLECSVNTVAEVMLLRYRDEYRVNRRADIQSSVAKKLADGMFSFGRSILDGAGPEAAPAAAQPAASRPRMRR